MLTLGVMLTAGIVATLLAAFEARSAGLRFVVTPWSIASALVQQAVTTFGLYGLAALARAALCALAAWRLRLVGQG